MKARVGGRFTVDTYDAQTGERDIGGGKVLARVQIVPSPSSEYWHPHLTFEAVPRGAGDSVASFQAWWQGLTVTAQGDSRSSERIAERQWPVYAERLGYQSHGDVVTAECAKRYADTLGAIERGLSKLSEHDGQPLSFGDYCGRVAQVVGARDFRVERNGEWSAPSDAHNLATVVDAALADASHGKFTNRQRVP